MIRLAGGVFPVLLVLGLFMAPVNCTCGASVPHGHSLFQLSHHNHNAEDHSPVDATSDSEDAFRHKTHPMMAAEPDCDEDPPQIAFSDGIALSNAIEQQENAVLQAPPNSSFGQPMIVAQPSSLEATIVEQCEPVDLPGTRVLEGMATSPETPPPRT